MAPSRNRTRRHRRRNRTGRVNRSLELYQKPHVLVLKGETAYDPSHFLRSFAEVLPARTGREALVSLELGMPDLVIADLDYVADLSGESDHRNSLLDRLSQARKKVAERKNGGSAHSFDGREFTGVDFSLLAKERGIPVVVSSTYERETMYKSTLAAYDLAVSNDSIEGPGLPHQLPFIPRPNTPAQRNDFRGRIENLLDALQKSRGRALDRFQTSDYRLFLIFGSTGAGKSRTIEALLDQEKDYEETEQLSLSQVLKCTSREKRDIDQEGIEALFVPGNYFETVPSDTFVTYDLYGGTPYGLPRRVMYQQLSNSHVLFASASEDLLFKLHAELGERLVPILLYPSKDVTKRRLELNGKDSRVAAVDGQYETFDRLIKSGVIRHVLRYSPDESPELAFPEDMESERKTMLSEITAENVGIQETMRARELERIKYRFAPRVRSIIKEAEAHERESDPRKSRVFTLRFPEDRDIDKKAIARSVRKTYNEYYDAWVDRFTRRLTGYSFSELLQHTADPRKDPLLINFDEDTIRAYQDHVQRSGQTVSRDLIRSFLPRKILVAGRSHGMAHIFLDGYTSGLPFGNVTERDIIKGLIRTRVMDYYFTGKNDDSTWVQESEYAHVLCTDTNGRISGVNDLFRWDVTDIPRDYNKRVEPDVATLHGITVGFARTANVVAIAREAYEKKRRNSFRPSSTDGNQTLSA